MMYSTCKFVNVLCKRTTSTINIVWVILFLLLGVSLFLFGPVNAQDLEVDRAAEVPREDDTDEDVIDGAFLFSSDVLGVSCRRDARWRSTGSL